MFVRKYTSTQFSGKKILPERHISLESGKCSKKVADQRSVEN
jgi:hypothetical protein